jgi:uncharacterized protein with WD repeat
MAYESVLNTAALLSAAPTSTLTTTSPNQGFSATAFFNISATTLGASVPGIALFLNVQTGTTSTSGLSAQYGTPTLTLSSTSAFPNQTYTGYIVNSTWAPTSATVTLGWNSPNLGTTSINLSANRTATTLDPTLTNTMDNWFFYHTNPEPATNRAVRTTLGQARLVSYMG